uniref:Uncharacterized protein n=1 Tax=Branchiostoma floridae TaxID=7739 RepID=C3ZP94_BRAFL|eukprot:XP_002589580.1 hypothetical protein BRAFLDRAFT_81538 [Branchiostoma floridae]
MVNQTMAIFIHWIYGITTAKLMVLQRAPITFRERCPCFQLNQAAVTTLSDCRRIHEELLPAVMLHGARTAVIRGRTALSHPPHRLTSESRLPVAHRDFGHKHLSIYCFGNPYGISRGSTSFSGSSIRSIRQTLLMSRCHSHARKTKPVVRISAMKQNIEGILTLARDDEGDDPEDLKREKRL